MKVRYARLFTNAAGHTEIEALSAELVPGFAAPPADPLHTAPFLQGDGTLFWVGATPDWNGGPPHPAPRPMVFVFLQGSCEVTTSDGRAHAFGPGDMLLMDDTTGPGHSTRNTGSQDCLLLGIGLPPA